MPSLEALWRPKNALEMNWRLWGNLKMVSNWCFSLIFDFISCGNLCRNELEDVGNINKPKGLKVAKEDQRLIGTMVHSHNGR